MKVALVHDYLTQRGGAERVFELLCRYFPDADIFTSLIEWNYTMIRNHALDRFTEAVFFQQVGSSCGSWLKP